MADGMWTLNDDGSFELQEPCATQLVEARIASTKGWTEALVEYLEPRCPYTAQELVDELVKRNTERDDKKISCSRTTSWRRCREIYEIAPSFRA